MLSHRYSNEMRTPLVVAPPHLATRFGRMPSITPARHKYAPISQQLLSLRNLPDLNHALLPEAAIVLSLAPVKSHPIVVCIFVLSLFTS